MKHFEVLRKWCEKIEIDILDKWLISLDRVTNSVCYITLALYIFQSSVSKSIFLIKFFTQLLYQGK